MQPVGAAYTFDRETDGDGMQINVTVDGLDGIDLSTVVGEGPPRYNPETDETECRPRTLGDMVAEKLAEKMWADSTDWSKIHRSAREMRDQVIRERVEPIITEALSKGFQLTNMFGEPTGEQVTLAELIVQEAKKVIGGSRSDHGRGQTLAQRLITAEVSRTFEAELRTEIEAEKAKVVAAVRGKAAELIAQSITQGLGGR